MKCRSCKRDIPENSIFCNWCGEKQLKPKKKKDEIKVPKPRQLKSGMWNIELRAEGASITEATEDMCIAKAKAVRAGFLEKQKQRSGITLDEAITRYIESRRSTVSPSTIQTYKKKQRLYFRSMSKKDINMITAANIQAEVDAMSAGLSPKTVKDAASFVIGVLQHNKVKIDRADIKFPQIQASPFAVLTETEIKTLLHALPGNPCELQILLAVWLGLRRSEIMALEKSDFDFAHSTVTINKAIVRDENGDYVEKGTKTAKSARVINCPQYIMGKVAAMPDGRLYQHDANYILKCLHKVCEENGLPPVRLHDLRHINASVGLMLGVPDKYVMERNGWQLKDTMVYRYEHTYSDEKAAADKKYNDFFEAMFAENS